MDGDFARSLLRDLRFSVHAIHLLEQPAQLLTHAQERGSELDFAVCALRQLGSSLVLTELAHALLRARDRETLVVQELLDAHRELDVTPPILPMRPPGLHRLEHLELALPVPKHVRLHAHDVRDLANAEEELVR